MIKSLVWVVSFFVLSFITLIFVPRLKILRLFTFGLVGGFGLALIYIYLFGNYFGFWEFRYLDFFSIRGMPLFLAATWFPLEILFAHFISFAIKKITIYSIITLFAVLGTVTQFILNYWGLLVFHNWNLVATFILAWFTHGGLAYYLFKYGILIDLRNSNPVTD